MSGRTVTLAPGKPHYRLHRTRRGKWWVALTSPDRTYTIASTPNFCNVARAISAASLLHQFARR